MGDGLLGEEGVLAYGCRRTKPVERQELVWPAVRGSLSAPASTGRATVLGGLPRCGHQTRIPKPHSRWLCSGARTHRYRCSQARVVVCCNARCICAGSGRCWTPPTPRSSSPSWPPCPSTSPPPGPPTSSTCTSWSSRRQQDCTSALSASQTPTSSSSSLRSRPSTSRVRPGPGTLHCPVVAHSSGRLVVRALHSLQPL